MREVGLGVCLLVLVHLIGCAAAPRGQAVEADVRSLPMYRGSGEPVSWADLVEAAAGADVVIIGENHGHPVGLPFAARLWDEVLARSSDAALSLEFFERDEQSRLDEYLQGVVDEATFRRRTGRTGSNYPPAHREMVEAARASGRPVIASNAPRPLVRLARTDGYDRLRGLSAAQRLMFRLPDALPEGRYREDFFELMVRKPEGGGGRPGHGHDTSEQERVEAMFRSQSVWDWTMAESIARALENGTRPVVHVVGRFHSDFDGGLVQALREMRPGARVVVVSVVDATPAGLKDDDSGRGQFVVYVGPAPKQRR
jgi:uncharacterized iron-regulated protein